MGEKNEKINKNFIEKRWLMIFIGTLLLSSFIMSMYRATYELGIYGDYYLRLITEFLMFPGSVFFLTGYLINKIIYFRNKKENSKIIMMFILVCTILVAGGLLFKCSGFYNNLKDLNYVRSNTYCEDIEDLNNVYIKVTTSKIVTKSLYIETLNHKFSIGKNIVAEKNYDSFVEEYNNVKKVKIKYLPNCNKLLEIEPVDDLK